MSERTVSAPGTDSVEVTINGEDRLLAAGTTIRQVLEQLNLPDCGVAVAVDNAVAAQDRWDEPIPAGARLDILTAVQGG